MQIPRYLFQETSTDVHFFEKGSCKFRDDGKDAHFAKTKRLVAQATSSAGAVAKGGKKKSKGSSDTRTPGVACLPADRSVCRQHNDGERLKVDVGKPTSVGDEKVEMVDNAKMNKYSKYVTLGEVSKVLGAKF